MLVSTRYKRTFNSRKTKYKIQVSRIISRDVWIAHHLLRQNIHKFTSATGASCLLPLSLFTRVVAALTQPPLLIISPQYVCLRNRLLTLYKLYLHVHPRLQTVCNPVANRTARTIYASWNVEGICMVVKAIYNHRSWLDQLLLPDFELEDACITSKACFRKTENFLETVKFTWGVRSKLL